MVNSNRENSLKASGPSKCYSRFLLLGYMSSFHFRDTVYIKYFQEELSCFLQNHLGNNLLVTILTFVYDLASTLLLFSEGMRFYPCLCNCILSFSTTHLFPLYFLVLYRVTELILLRFVVTHCFSAEKFMYKILDFFQIQGEVKKKRSPGFGKNPLQSNISVLTKP